MVLPAYDFNIKWHTYIDLTKIKINSIEYIADEEEPDDNINNDNNNIDLNTINFSLDNEQILNEIQQIIEIEDISVFSTLEVLKKQDLLSSYF